MANGIHREEIVLFLYSTPDTVSAGIQDKVNSQRNTVELYQGRELPSWAGMEAQALAVSFHMLRTTIPGAIRGDPG